MIEPKTKLEKFLVNAIRNAREEVKEETETLREGGDAKQSSLVIEKILDDLLNSAENSELYLLDDEDFPSQFEEARIAIKKEIEEKEIVFKFEVGEICVFGCNPVYYGSNHLQKLKKKFGYPDDEPFGVEGEYLEGEEVLILAKCPPTVNFHQNHYVIEHDGTKYFVDEWDLEKL